MAIKYHFLRRCNCLHTLVAHFSSLHKLALQNQRHYHFLAVTMPLETIVASVMTFHFGVNEGSFNMPKQNICILRGIIHERLRLLSTLPAAFLVLHCFLLCSLLFLVSYLPCIFLVSYLPCIFLVSYLPCIFLVSYLSCIFLVSYLSCIFFVKICSRLFNDILFIFHFFDSFFFYSCTRFPPVTPIINLASLFYYLL